MTLLKPYIHQRYKGQIWKLATDPAKNLIFIESRDAADHLVSFSGCDLNTGEACFTELITHEKWLTGIESCFNGVLFLHGYESAQSPVHKGITAIDGLTGGVLWSNYTYAIHHISVNGPIAYNTQVLPQKLFLLDANTGAALRPFDASIDHDIDPEIRVPYAIDTLEANIVPYLKGDRTGMINYIEYNSFRIVSLHTLVKTDLSQILLIMQGDDLVYEDLLIDGIQKLQPEAFIMQRNRLIYIKNKVELKVLNL